jgi:cephalosporin-C deacetylase-like acetyl esterase
MAIRALLSDIGKDFLGVARVARHALMHAAQRIAGLDSMVELRDSPDGSPTGGGVAVAARNLESRAVRATAVLPYGRLLILGGAKRCPQQKRPGNSYRPVRNYFPRFPQALLEPQLYS